MCQNQKNWKQFFLFCKLIENIYLFNVQTINKSFDSHVTCSILSPDRWCLDQTKRLFHHTFYSLSYPEQRMVCFNAWKLKLNVKESRVMREGANSIYNLCHVFVFYFVQSIQFIFKHSFLYLLSKLPKHCYCWQNLKVPLSFDAAARRKRAAGDEEDRGHLRTKRPDKENRLIKWN